LGGKEKRAGFGAEILHSLSAKGIHTKGKSEKGKFRTFLLVA
jgi:hypothetical protein